MEGNNKIDHQCLQKQLKHLDKVLRCKVCRNHLSNASCLALCGHSFCNTCLTGRVRCPECYFPIWKEDHSIVPNRALNEMVHNFKELRMVDEQCMSSKRWTIPEENEPSPFGSSDDDIFQEYKIPEALQKTFQSLSCLLCGEFFSIAVCIRVCGHSFCSFCIRQVFQNNKTGVHRQKNQCLICRAEIGESTDKHLVINRTIQQVVVIVKNIVRLIHGINVQRVDFTNPRLSPSEEPPINSRFPSRHYDKMKPRDLRDLCGKYGLSRSGEVKDVRDRLKLFATLWNAEVDSIFPRPQSKLVEEMKQRECAHLAEAVRNRSNYHSVHLKKLSATVDHNNGVVDATLTSGNESFDIAFSEGFKALIRQGKWRKDVAKSSHDSTKDDNQTSLSSELTKLDFRTELEGRIEEDAETNLLNLNKNQSSGSSESADPEGRPFSKSANALNGSSNTDTIEEDDCSVIEVWTEQEWNATVVSNNARIMNKENNSSSSPPMSNIIVPSLPSLASQMHDCLSPKNEKNTSLDSDGKASQSPSSSKLRSTPATKRGSPTYVDTSATRTASNASKQRRVSWQCPLCTYINDGSVMGFCAVCQHTRKPVK
jgi:hypothetical protein